ncbi:MAG: undecaprenyldiphospho-muramoylpentapeptide beta-N-acetylglucosaminyltransferase [Sphaerobacteraceae bacterium]|nr:MAG: undecaprenyldiphospho-muramoylpentapeptide beta-N-acetylglucosaminyltransferase [Sphaerobacteraceae bacterium]
MTDRPTRIVIAGGGTGGHVQPAIAVSSVLRQRADVELTWIGSSGGIEKLTASEQQILFHAIPTGKLRRYFSIHTLLDAVRIPFGILRARLLLRSLQPDVVFSTGGFVSVPTVVAAWMAGIPSITHEQTATIGLANKINARLADRIALAYTQTRELLSSAGERIIITGNPVRGGLKNGDSDRGLTLLGFTRDLPVVYVTGGSLGAQAVNQTIQKAIPDLVQHAQVIHQCGPAAANGDYPRLLEARKSLPADMQSRYVVRERIGEELADIYACADLVIGRSGGGTVAELALLGKPSILVPLPGTSSDEQTRNARVLADVDASILIPQVELSPERLVNQLRELLSDPERRAKMSDAARSVAMPDAAERLADEILQLASVKRSD